MASVSNWRSRIVGSDDVAPDELLANPRNWRIHPKAQQDALAGALDQVGWVQRVIVNRQTGHLVDGHLRVELALRRNEPSVPVEYVDLTPEEEGLVLASLDPIAAMAATDAEKLRQLLAEVEFDSKALEDALDALAPQSNVGNADPDDVPEVNENDVYVRPGDIWLLGRHRIACGDATKPDDVQRLIAGERIDLSFTSPPYNSGNGGYKTDYAGKTKKFYAHNLDNRSEIEWVEFCSAVLRLTGEIMRSDSSAVLWNIMYTANCRAGYGKLVFSGDHPFRVHETICWDKEHGFPTATKGILSRNWELVFVMSQGDRYESTQGPHEPRWAKWEIARPDKQHELHKATFPVELVNRVLIDYLVGSTVYDPFLGSGTTMMACETFDAVCYGMEIDPRYVQVAIERWQKFTGRKAERADG